MSRIIKLESENILCLKAICIVPGGPLVKITGPNDSGKTANLKSIWMALGGKKEIPDDAIREGQDSGFVELTIGEGDTVDCTVRLNLTRRADGTIKEHEIIFKDEKGITRSSPMALIRDLLGFGHAQFDPLVFRDAKPAEQVKMLQSALGLDFSELNAEHDKQYAKRTDINGEAKILEAQIPADDPEAPSNEVSVATLSEAHAEAMAAKAQNMERKNRIKAAVENSLHCDDKLTKLNDERAELELDMARKKQEIIEQITECENSANTLTKVKESKILEVADTDAIEEQIRNAEGDNARARAMVDRAEKTEQVNELKSRSETITESLATIKATKEKMIADADFPIAGVAIDSGEILINGHPLANQGSAAQLRFGTLLVIKSDPRLRIVTMDEGLGKLDDESLEMLGVLMDEYKFQAWLTGPRGVGEGCIVISAGEVVSDV